jgi:uncharacterized membrane protein YhiD involved in acid resistance
MRSPVSDIDIVSGTVNVKGASLVLARHAAGAHLLGVCAFLMLAQRTAGGPAEQADAFYGVLFGMGFVGSGAVVRSREDAPGLSTAVSLWVTGAIGAGVAYGDPLVSTAVSLIVAAAFWAPSLARRMKATS